MIRKLKTLNYCKVLNKVFGLSKFCIIILLYLKINQQLSFSHTELDNPSILDIKHCIRLLVHKQS